MKRLPMRKIRDAMRLRADGLSVRAIGVSLGVGRTTAGDYLKRADAVGLVWPLVDDMSDAALEHRLYPDAPDTARRGHVQPDWSAIHREMRRKNVTLMLLWEEYRATHPDDGYGYSRFCELYRRWEGRLSPTMRQHHRRPANCTRRSSLSPCWVRQATRMPKRHGRRACPIGSAPILGHLRFLAA